MSSQDDIALLHPGAAAERLGIATRTLASWADAGIIAAIVTVGGHRRYRSSDIDQLASNTEQAAAADDLTLPEVRPVGRSRGSYSRRGRPLTKAEVEQLAGAATVQAWAALAAGYQADGSSIRQIAACTGTLSATVAARITRHNRAVERST